MTKDNDTPTAPKRLLCIVGGMNAGGAETFLIKLHRALDRTRYQMDYCVSTRGKCFYDDEILQLGGRILRVTAKSRNPLAFVITLYRAIKGNGYGRVMRVSQHSLAGFDLALSAVAGVKTRVYRSSNSDTMNPGIEKLTHRLFGFLPRLFATVKIAPSTDAAEFMFGSRAVHRGKVLLLHNGLPLERFAYNAEARQRLRAEMGLSADAFVVGHIGRFERQKNHAFLMDIFSEIVRRKPTAHLLLAGQGSLEETVRDSATQMGIADRIHFMGVRSDVAALLSAMDAFVFPSLHEGMPNAVLEAQANGAPCIIADTITREVLLTDNITMLPLGDARQWADAVDAARRLPSATNVARLRTAGYDMEDVVKSFVATVFES